ncbi:Metal ion binding protein [Zea mays]|uniref:Metal ion binding protein n=1 Tax=Zea mays TaxID=4577 RepID=A0A1D6JNX9_MAIZE|nr:Metal ion binding protein [Zea mays]|eukprot:XP_020408477.1 metal ion binding protein isoform X1 [Zea mays]
MGAGKGGDGGEAAPEAAQPVVLKMKLHCAGCAHKVKKAIKRVPGVDSIVTDVAANTVVVVGTADAGALKARLEAKTNKPVEIVSAGGAPKKPPAAEPKQDAGAGVGEKKGVKSASPNEEEKEKGKKQQAEEKEREKEKGKKQQVGTRQAMPPTQPNYSSDPQQQQQLKNASSAFGSPQVESVLLKIRLHCDGCADRIRRRIGKIKGVKDVVLEANAKDEVEVTGTMDIPNMVSYLKEKLNRDVEAVALPVRKEGGGSEGEGEGKDDKKHSGGGGGKDKVAAGAAGDDRMDKGKGIEASAAGPSTAAAAAYMSAPAGASTYHVAPPHGYVAYEQAPPPASYYPYPYYGYGSGDGMGHANPSYYQPQPQPQPDGNQQPQVAYPPYPYQFDMAPAPQLFSDENPNACSVM